MEVMTLPPRTGRPPKGETPRRLTLNIRLSEEEADMIKSCADALGLTRTDAIMKGIQLLKAELDKQK